MMPLIPWEKVLSELVQQVLGYSNIREGIVYSMNIVAVRCMMETISPELGVQYAEKWESQPCRIKITMRPQPLAESTSGVSNLELTGAYAAIAAGSVYKTRLFTKIVDHDGKVLIENVPERHQALKPQTAFLLTDALREAVSGGAKFASVKVSPTGGRARVPA